MSKRDASSAIATGTKYVRRMYLNGKQVTKTDDDPDLIEVFTFEAPPAEVTVEIKEVKNLGNYDSLHVTIGCRLPCYPEEKDDALAYAADWVKSALVNEVPQSVYEEGVK